MARWIFMADQQVDYFRIVRPLGRGGMGEVYLARDMKLGRKVALKILHPKALGSKEAVKSFVVEARTTARFNHPHIVTIYAVGNYQGLPYLALEYLKGQSLRKRLDEGRPGIKESMRICLAVAEALAEAHRRNILHGDLTTRNVFIPRDGQLRVLDFGFARFLDVAPEVPAGARSAGSREPGVDEPEDRPFFGTPYYIAPEQWLRRPPTDVTDIWALGVIMHELAAGALPFPGGSLWEVREKVLDPEPLSMNGPRPDGERAFDALVLRCLEKEPRRRPRAEEVAELLHQMIAGDRRSSDEDRSPFRGLLPFDEVHADLFFGRGAEVSAFLERARLEPVLPVLGPSGSGKSSFIQAGVLPRLREQGPLIVIKLRPGHEPFGTLASRLLAAERDLTGEASPPGRTITVAGLDDGAPEPLLPIQARRRRLASRLEENPRLLSIILLSLAEQARARAVLFVDQLEEIYTFADDYTRRRFMHAVCAAADDPQDPVRVVFTLRDDFLGRLAEGAVVREVLSHVTVIRTPAPGALEETLVAPLTAVGYRYDDPALAATMAAQVRGEPACLPLLQAATSILWERRDPDRRILRRDVFDDMGGVGGALATHADAMLEGLSGAQMDHARELILRLVSPGGTRRILSRAQVLDGLAAGAEQTLQQLIAARLISVRKVADRPEDVEIELAHESLIHSWDRLVRWIEEGREDLAFLAEVGQAAELWDRRGRRGEEVWQRDALVEARLRAERCTARVPDLVRRFLAAGTHKQRRQQRARRLRRVVAFGVLATVAAAAVVVAVSFSRQNKRVELQRAEAQREGARAAFLRGDLLESRAKLRRSLETRDSAPGRMLWQKLSRQPGIWRRAIGAIVYSVDVSPDGRLVAIASQDRAVYLLDVVTGAVRRVLRGHGDQVLAVAFAPDGRRLASAGLDGSIRVWDVAARRETQKIRGARGTIFAVTFSGDGRWLAAAGEDGKVRLWDARTGVMTRVLDSRADSAFCVEFGAAGRIIAACGSDGAVQIWNVADGAEVRRLEGHARAVRGAHFSPDGRTLATASVDGSVQIWDVETAARRARLTAGAGAVRCARFSPDGRLLVSAGIDGVVRLWDAATGAPRQRLSGHTAAVYGVSFSPDGRRLASAGIDGSVRLWELAAAAAARRPSGHADGVNSVRFSPDGRLLATAGSDRAVRIWTVSSGESRPLAGGHTKAVLDTDFSPDGRLLATAGADRAVCLWDARTGARLRRLTGHRGAVHGVSFSPDGRWLASGGGDRVIRLWDVKTGDTRRVLGGHTDAVHDVSFSPDGRWLASSGRDRTIRLWDLRTGEPAQTLTDHGATVDSVGFSPDGRWLASGGRDMKVALRDLGAGTTEAIPLPGRVYAVAFDRAGRRLGCACSDRRARLRDLNSGKTVTLDGHQGEVNSISFGPAGRLVATASDDDTVRVWEVGGRPFWRAPALLGSPPEMLTHRGWSKVGDVSLRARPAAPSTRWRRALARLARITAAGPDSKMICVATSSGHLEIWDTRTDARRLRRVAAGVEALVATPAGCVVLTRGRARLHGLPGGGPPGGGSQIIDLISSGARAATRGRGRIYIAAGRKVSVFDDAGQRRSKTFDIDVGVTALGLSGRWLVAGYLDGNIELLSLKTGKRRARFSFESVPSSPPVRMLEGPMNTMIVGYASGLLGIWDLEYGTRLHHVRLHGPVAHMLLQRERLYAVTALGDPLVMDLDILTRGYCSFMRQVWKKAPVVWHRGRPTPRSPAADHRCATR